MQTIQFIQHINWIYSLYTTYLTHDNLEALSQSHFENVDPYKPKRVGFRNTNLHTPISLWNLLDSNMSMESIRFLWGYEVNMIPMSWWNLCEFHDLFGYLFINNVYNLLFLFLLLLFFFIGAMLYDILILVNYSLEFALLDYQFLCPIRLLEMIYIIYVNSILSSQFNWFFWQIMDSHVLKVIILMKIFYLEYMNFLFFIFTILNCYLC